MRTFKELSEQIEIGIKELSEQIEIRIWYLNIGNHLKPAFTASIFYLSVDVSFVVRTH